MQKSIERRLLALENAKNVGCKEYIGKYFDELTEEQQNAYCQYRYSCDPQIMIDCEMMVDPNFSLHFVCDERPKPPTRQQLIQIAEEVQEIVYELTHKQEE